MAIVIPDKCLRCDEPWTEENPYLARGLHGRCYRTTYNRGELDLYPSTRYKIPYQPRQRNVGARIEVECKTPSCTRTAMRTKGWGTQTFRCERCRYAKVKTGFYDETLLNGYDLMLPPKERVEYWLNPNNLKNFRGKLVPFVQPGGPEGDCLIWQRQKHGNPAQMAASQVYAKCHWYGKNERVHRVVASVMFNIPLEELLVVDHLCEVKSCVNPDHLHPCTLAENTAGRIKTKRLETKIVHLEEEVKRLTVLLTKKVS
ncbi:MAG: hypothetical protein CBD49_00940 [Acidimicrobiaceae bacterium TMED189]|nr:MAG: hypothetical protein CBD49_00940 [Acidimicrobiaceae bacterium TMED189]